MSNKDFLSQFSGENKKPASFSEEVRTPVNKQRKPISPWVFIIPAIAIITVGVVLYFIFLRPNIDVTNFIGQQKEDAVAWIRQQGIESSGIVFKEEYDFDNVENIIIDQDPIEGKVRKDAKMTFVLSKGPNPDDSVAIPNFESMNKSDISEWIRKNKLLSTKINTTYSDTIDVDGFIKAEYTDCDESSFTRGCSLKISVSKGPRPADEVEMQNFVKKQYEELEIWAATKGIKVEKLTSYSDTYSENQIMAQSVKEKEVIKVGDTVTVMVSKGKAVIMEDFVGKPYDDFTYWTSKVSLSSAKIMKKTEYNNDYGVDDIISQSVKKGSVVEDELIMVVSLGKPKLDSSTTVEELRLWKETVNADGADVHVGNTTYENSDTVGAGKIIRMNYSNYVPVGASLDPVVSLGKNIFLKDIKVTSEDHEITLEWEHVKDYTEDQIRKLCEDNKVNYKVSYINKQDVDNNKVVEVTRDSGEVEAHTYISESEVINVVICDKSK